MLLLLGGLEHEFYFSIQLGISSSQLNFIFYKSVETIKQYYDVAYIQ